jgi:hypothetical protein
MVTKLESTMAPTAAVSPAAAGYVAHSAIAARTLASTWAVPVQGIRMPNPACPLGSTAGMTTATGSAAANAAKGATRKDATGGEAFEDPL